MQLQQYHIILDFQHYWIAWNDMDAWSVPTNNSSQKIHEQICGIGIIGFWQHGHILCWFS